MKKSPKYRLALDLGTTSLGWAMLRLDDSTPPKPTAIIKTGVRIFSDGRNPKSKESLAVSRRDARSARRRRDRLLKRKARMMDKLIEHGFFPKDKLQRKQYEALNPYQLRAKGLHDALTPEEFARAIFHLTQRRGFKSNRKTDSKDSDSGLMKSTISQTRQDILDSDYQTLGEWLWHRLQSGQPTRARYREHKEPTTTGKSKTVKSYDLYIDRQMIVDEFDALWAKQAEFNPTLCNDKAREDIRDTLTFQRNLKPVQLGKCTLMPEFERAHSALPSAQNIRIYQDLNHLKIINADYSKIALTLEQRDVLANQLLKKSKLTFTQINKALGLPSTTRYNLQSEKCKDIKGNQTNVALSKNTLFDTAWYDYSLKEQDEIVQKLISEQNEDKLIHWLCQNTQLNEEAAQHVANARLVDGTSNLSIQAIYKIQPELIASVCTYDKAVKQAGFGSHSQLGFSYEPHEVDEWLDTSTGELKSIFKQLPYYGKALPTRVMGGSGEEQDSDEKRYGKIANPTVHIGLNQVRTVVNALIKEYGRPTEIVVELARELKNSKAERDSIKKKQTINQKNNERIKKEIAQVLNIPEDSVKRSDIQKWILWEELAKDPADRACPFTGQKICKTQLFSPEVEIEHILPFSRTLDDTLNNKTVALRAANRIKRNRTPWEAREEFASNGWLYDDILTRTKAMPKAKAYRFAPDAIQQWEGDNNFVARALNDTKYLSKIARVYLSLICPGKGLGDNGVNAVPGKVTAILRRHLGLNGILGLNGEKNREDHRHHAVDACVIGIIDPNLLKQFALANKQAKDEGLTQLVKDFPPPWPTYRQHVQRAVENIWVSHKPDHSHQGQMHNDTAYGLLGNGHVRTHKLDNNGQRIADITTLSVIEFTDETAIKADGTPRHGQLDDGSAKPYKGYKGDSNYCIEIIMNEKGKWKSEVISTYQAYQTYKLLAKQYKQTHGKHSTVPSLKELLDPKLSLSGKPLVMRFFKNDTLALTHEHEHIVARVCTFNQSGQIYLSDIKESNVDARNRDKENSFKYISKTAGSLQTSHTKLVTVSPIGKLCYRHKP